MSWNNVIPAWLLDEESCKQHLNKIKNKKGCEHMNENPTQVATEVTASGPEIVEAPTLAPEGFTQTAEDLGLTEQAVEQESIPL